MKDMMIYLGKNLKREINLANISIKKPVPKRFHLSKGQVRDNNKLNWFLGACMVVTRVRRIILEIHDFS